MNHVTRLPAPLQARLERAARAYFEPPAGLAADFSAPVGAAALVAHDSLTWQVMKNPVALVVGGVAAVILELAEPRVRTGVWEHTSFRRDPVTRIRRTGYAAMVSIYAPAEAARAMIANVVRAHARIEGATAGGLAYRANDEALLTWVHATAMFGFAEAYSHFVRPLSRAEFDRFYAEGAPIAALYGVPAAPVSANALEAFFATMAPHLEHSDVIFEFLEIMCAAPFLPSRALQRLMIRAAVDITPAWARERLGLGAKFGLHPGGASLLRVLGAASDKIVIESAAPALASQRVGLPADYLYR